LTADLGLGDEDREELCVGSDWYEMRREWRRTIWLL